VGETDCAVSIDILAGVRLNVLSVCQNWLARLIRRRLSFFAQELAVLVEVRDVLHSLPDPALAARRLHEGLRREFQFAEAFGECELLLLGYRLVVKYQDRITIEGGLDFCEDRIGQAPEIDVADFGDERRRDRFDGYHFYSVIVRWAECLRSSRLWPISPLHCAPSRPTAQASMA
jgi:hypothetical protein